MNDNFFKRTIHGSVALVGGFLFLYFMILTTQNPPREFALKYVLAFECMAKWFFGLMSAIIVLLVLIAFISQLRDQKRALIQKELREIENKKVQELAFLREEEEKNRKTLALIEAEKVKLLELEIKKRNQQKRSEYLKTRSARDAVNDSLKQFL